MTLDEISRLKELHRHQAETAEGRARLDALSVPLLLEIYHAVRKSMIVNGVNVRGSEREASDKINQLLGYVGEEKLELAGKTAAVILEELQAINEGNVSPGTRKSNRGRW